MKKPLLTIVIDTNSIQYKKNISINNGSLRLALFGQTENIILVGAEAEININQSDYIYNNAKIT